MTQQSWWRKLRNGSSSSADWDKVNALVGMGFHPNEAVKALKVSNNDVQRATDQILHDQGGHRNPKQTPTPGCTICHEIFVKEQQRIERNILAQQRLAEHERLREQRRLQRTHHARHHSSAHHSAHHWVHHDDSNSLLHSMHHSPHHHAHHHAHHAHHHVHDHAHHHAHHHAAHHHHHHGF